MSVLVNETPAGPGGFTTTDVLIVGAGPAGLTAANLLGQAGVETLLIERDEGLSGIPKALMVDDEFFRLLNTLGLGEAVHAHGVHPVSYDWYSPLGFRIAYNEGRLTEHNFPNRTAIFQPTFERILYDGARRFPSIRAHFNEELIGLRQHADRVEATVRDASGVEKTYRACYVLGADGARSRTRDLLGIAFEELFHLDEHHLVVDVADDPDLSKRARLRAGWGRRHFSSLPAPGGRRYEFSLRPGEDADAVLRDETLAQLFKPIRDFADVKVIRKAVYSFRSRLAKSLGKGRVFILGDAAHTMPVTGSQGMNSGARDANNLGWKLALVIKGRAGPALLNTYHDERHGQVADTIRVATAQTKLRSVKNLPFAVARDVLLGIVMLAPPLRRYVAEMRYIPKPFLRQGIVLNPGARGEGSCVGRVLPHPYVLRDGKKLLLDDVIGPNWAVLGIRPADPSPAGLGHALWRELRATILVIDAPRGALDRARNGIALALGDDPRFDNLVRAHAGLWLVVRPDRIVAAAVRGDHIGQAADSIAALLQTDRARLGVNALAPVG